MSGAGLEIEVFDGASPMLTRLVNGLTNRQPLNARIGADERALVEEHLRQISLSRHDSAEALGASPTGFWGDADKRVTSTADADGATLSLTHPGIGRAFHAVTITPGDGKQWLTLPLLAEAYGQRAYRFPDLFFVQPKGKDFALLGRRAATRGPARKGKATDYNESGDGIGRAGGDSSQEVSWLYLLVHEVHQQQDRTLLPSDEEFTQTARVAATEYLDRILAIRGNN